MLLDDLDAEVARDLHDRVASDSGEHGIAEWSGVQHAVADDEEIFAGAFADEAVDVECDAFGVAVDDGLHLDELRIHVVRAGFGHNGQRVGSDARPGRDANVDSLTGIGAQIFSPGVIADVDFGG